ncbi:hypothetical protein [Nonomuraea sp. LPB2021202275-12-8]|uniref:hypothetical protein n=1 Tax=Nonomuraea sp. LPB2021202275-12-8 TaxID=3120159 RepID=UPI00300C47CA
MAKTWWYVVAAVAALVLAVTIAQELGEPARTAQRPPATAPPTSTAPAVVPAGFPDAASTGVSPGTELAVVTGDQTFARDGEVVEGKEFRGFVEVTGRGITFRNCLFSGGVADRVRPLLDTEHARDTVIEDSEFRPAHPSPSVDGIWAASTKIYRSEFTGTVDGVKAHTGTLVQDSYIHHLSWFAADPDQGGGPTHNDGVQAFADQRGVSLVHNTIDLSTTRDPNAAVQSSADELRVEGNYLDGGACVVNIDHTPLGRPLTGQRVTGNRFGRASAHDCPILLSTRSELAAGSGNVWHDTGEPIPAPERHD